MKQYRFTDEQIIGLIKQADAGMSVKELCRSGGFSQPTLTLTSPKKRVSFVRIMCNISRTK